jgi:hypothetical protein
MRHLLAKENTCLVPSWFVGCRRFVAFILAIHRTMSNIASKPSSEEMSPETFHPAPQRELSQNVLMLKMQVPVHA